MANEASQKTRFSAAVGFKWFNDDIGADKGTILKLSGARIVAAATADNDIAIGILARDKIAGDGRDNVAVYIDGIYDCLVQGASAAIGDDLVISGANTLKKYTTLDNEKGYVLGKALEAVTGSDTIEVLLNKK